MVLTKGEKVFVISRRRFETDLRRHFVGEVEAASETTMRVRGYAFVFDESINDFVRRDQPRIRIFSLTDAGLTIIVLPGEVDPEQVRYAFEGGNMRIITDEKSFKMNVSEFGARR